MRSWRVGWWREPTALAAIGLTVAFAYVVFVAEAIQADPILVLRVANGAIAGGLILVYLVRAPLQADRIDRAILMALLLFSVAGMLAMFPRQALDATLAALLYAAAFFVARGILHTATYRQLFVTCLVVLSFVMTFLTAARWLPPVVEWWSLTDWSVIPPLDLDLPAVPWGHRHDLTLLVVLLYPAWWIGRITPVRAAIGSVVGVLAAALVVVDGSRAVWLAILVASIVVAIPFARRFWNEHPRRAKVIVAVAAAVTGIAVLSGAAAVLLDRVLTSASVVTRLAMWGPLVEAWVSKPLTGFGPGSFPWILQQTPYFETNSLAPRHPDNAIVQLLGEGGVVGLAAMGIVIGVGVVAVVRTRSIAARFPLICFGVACVNANPSDFMFLVAVAIGWAAYALPRAAATEPAPRASRLLKAATVACAAVIGVAWTSTAVADVSYASARSAVESGNFSSAAEQLALAESLDPGMALYRRQHGAALLQLGDVDGAIEDLEAAVRINPSDDLAWRVLALARDAQDDPASARSAIDQALAAQRSDPANLLVSATLAAERGDDGEVNRTLEEVVQAWPEIVTAPGWDGLLSPGISSQVVLGAAFGRWLDGIVGPEPSALQPMTLAVMTGQPELAAAEADAVLGPSLGPAYLQVLGCDPAGDATLAAAPNSDRRDAVYWLLVARQARAEGQPDAQAERLFWLMTHAPFFEDELVPPLNPLNDVRGGYSSDQAGYRRLGVFWPDFNLLPSPAAGQTQWFGYPHEAVEAVGLASLIQACR